MSESERLGMSERNERGSAVHAGKAGRRRAAEMYPGRSTATNDFYVSPDDALRLTGSEGFHCGLLRSETGCEVRCWAPPSGAIPDLLVGKDPPQKPVSVLRDDLLDSWNLGGVEACTHYLHVFMLTEVMHLFGQGRHVGRPSLRREEQ
jgi:hypothetical protein